MNLKHILPTTLALALYACANVAYDHTVSITDSRLAGAHFYGAGERGHSIDLTGDTLTMYNRPNYGYGAGDPRISTTGISMPLLLTSNGYAVLFDDYAASTLIPGDTISYITESPYPVTYRIIDGQGTLAGAVEALTSITGRQELPPLWTLGYITSRYGYRTQQETLGVVDTLRRHGYPLDGLILDLYWYGREEDMGRLAWEPDQWPDPAGMLAQLSDSNVNTVTISQPYVLRNGRGADNFDFLSDNAMLLCDSTGATQTVEIWVGDGGMFDMSNPDTRHWLAERYDSLYNQGLAGFWGDLGEPEKHPETGLHANGLKARQYHNRYGNDWASIIYDMMAERHPDTRPMVMMRGGTTGLQRYSVFPWTGDVSRSWAGMQAQPTLMIQSGLSGLGYMSHDVGGFAIDPEAPKDTEMYTRWLQLGLFSPVLRTHAQQSAEPYNYPEAEHILLDIIRERYAWLPYNYTLAWENSSRGLPLVRPLNFYSGTPLHDDITDQYLWGRDVMVAPVMTPGTTERTVVIPDGLWIDPLNPRTVHTLGDTIVMEAPIDRIPMLVRAGSFIPRADYHMTSTVDYDPSRLTVDYYPVDSVESTYTLYDDDRMTPNRGDHPYTTLTFSGADNGDTITVSITAAGSYPGAPGRYDINLRVHRLLSSPATVSIDRRDVPHTYTPTTGTLTIPVTLRPDSSLTLTLTR